MKFLDDCIHAHAPVHFIVPLRGSGSKHGSARIRAMKSMRTHWVVLRDLARVPANIDAFIGEREALHQTSGNVRVNIIG
ncbi:hypothetical protein SB861_49330 [Paraburkholderia sp. SIMBA_049]